MAIDERDAIKRNAIKMAMDHSKKCDGEGCDIQLGLLLRAIELAGIEVTLEEQLLFM